MHPNRAFDWNDPEAMLRFVDTQTFAQVFTASDAGLFVVHVPVMVRDGRVWFHVSRRNRIAGEIDGRRLLVNVTGRHAYHSANWYISRNEVPTWHYESVEIEGEARMLSDDELVTLLDELSDWMERRHSHDEPWTRDKMEPGRFEALTRAIVGFEVNPAEIRGTRKFNQHKKGEELAAIIDGQRGAGRDDIVAAIHEMTTKDE
jgi:transcriptional regulator